ncbi:MAG: hypothetical protein CVT78_10470 [Alphaproteobacteria bacterium HGW-Alphaproteobacteria-17]|nr:MAG: hypothetical protein CVT78_10470 [Alphaproteobacteria bacterium HGW-Alphaproteobacteria-17]
MWSGQSALLLVVAVLIRPLTALLAILAAILLLLLLFATLFVVALLLLVGVLVSHFLSPCRRPLRRRHGANSLTRSDVALAQRVIRRAVAATRPTPHREEPRSV